MKETLFSPDRLYRYTLYRCVDALSLGERVVFVLLNPSTADENRNDPTVRRCIGYARRWGYGEMNVLNLFALRSTDPRALYKAPDPVGPDNDARILQVVEGAQLVVCAWACTASSRIAAARSPGCSWRPE